MDKNHLPGWAKLKHNFLSGTFFSVHSKGGSPRKIGDPILQKRPCSIWNAVSLFLLDVSSVFLVAHSDSCQAYFQPCHCWSTQHGEARYSTPNHPKPSPSPACGTSSSSVGCFAEFPCLSNSAQLSLVCKCAITDLIPLVFCAMAISAIRHLPKQGLGPGGALVQLLVMLEKIGYTIHLHTRNDIMGSFKWLPRAPQFLNTAPTKCIWNAERN